jgi:hypothetical protein
VEGHEGVFGRQGQAFDPSLLYVALDGESMVGIVICRAYPEFHQGYINQIACTSVAETPVNADEHARPNPSLGTYKQTHKALSRMTSGLSHIIRTDFSC